MARRKHRRSEPFLVTFDRVDATYVALVVVLMLTAAAGYALIAATA